MMARGWIWILLIDDDEEEEEEEEDSAPDDATPSADLTTTGGESTSMVGLDWILDFGLQHRVSACVTSCLWMINEFISLALGFV